MRGEEIWIRPGDGAYRRREQHLRLLREGLLHEDRWTISKAIALMLRGEVPESDIVAVVLRHFGRHVASSRGAEAGVDLARFVNGVAIGLRYGGEDRLMALTTAATSASGEAAERLEVVSLPEPVTWDRISSWVRLFSRNGQENRIEEVPVHGTGKGVTKAASSPAVRMRRPARLSRVQRKLPDPGIPRRADAILRLGGSL